jgi:hypothetical protein
MQPYTQMKLWRVFAVGIVSALSVTQAGAWYYAWARPVGSWEPYYPPYNSVGLVETIVAGEPYRGSAAVARDHRLLYSCGHLVYDNGRWASVFRFLRSYHSYYRPLWYQYRAARGYFKLAGYTPFGYFYDFDDDFAVAYTGATGWFGPPLQTHPNPIAGVESFEEKMVLGYPSDLDHTYLFDTGRYYLHRTGPFTQRYYDENVYQEGGEYWLEGVTTGGGNSGGPLLVKDQGQYKLAGVLVSGSYLGGSGVYVLGGEAEQLADAALNWAANGSTATRWAWPSGWIQNASSTYASRTFNFTGVPSQTMEVTMNLGIYTGRRGDLDAFVRSPAGRYRVIAWRNAANSQANLVLQNEDITSNFQYYGAAGTWTLYFRDVFSGNPSWFQYASLSVRSRWPN